MRRIVHACILAALATLPGGAARAQGPSEVVFPKQSLPMKFSHRMHLKFKLQCDFCHEKAESSTSGADNLIPSEETCRTCHKIDRNQPEKDDLPEARCDACHLGPDPVHPARVEVPPPNLKFNHKVHVDRKIECARCHVGLDKAELATRDHLPRMGLCLGCHNATVAAGKSGDKPSHRGAARCQTCHLTESDGTLKTEFPTGILSPSGALKGDRHTPDFATQHAQVASDAAYCESCHRRDFCLSCHNGVVKPMGFHGNDYLAVHAVDARKASLRCDGCHRRQSFCVGCHERAGVVDLATADAPGSIGNLRPRSRFHPPYDRWTKPPRTPEHHSWQAERNVKQCIACHREESCLECHSTADGPGRRFSAMSPHPPGFAGSRGCETLSARNGRVCLKCHNPDDPHLTCR